MTIFYSIPIPDGHSWTIISKFGHILQTAEAKYGERDKSYTILGIEFTKVNNPQIWYPEACKNIIIQITVSCSDDMNRAVYQVAHEAIHCLFPSGGENSNFLEEGLATHFSIEYTQSNGHGTWNSNDTKYEEALNLVNELFGIDPHIIKKLRYTEPILSLVTKELLIITNSKIPEDLAAKLVRRF